MPVFIVGGMVNTNLLRQNSAVFLGTNRLGGWDANMKLNTAEGAAFGIVNVQRGGRNITFDNMEFIDGAINDSDVKISPTVNR